MAEWVVGHFLAAFLKDHGQGRAHEQIRVGEEDVLASERVRLHGAILQRSESDLGRIGSRRSFVQVGNDSQQGP